MRLLYASQIPDLTERTSVKRDPCCMCGARAWEEKEQWGKIRICFSNITHNRLRHWRVRQGFAHLEGLDARSRRYARDNDLGVLDPLNDLLVGVARVRRQIVGEGGVGPRVPLARDAAHNYAILGKDLGIRRRQHLSRECPALRSS